MKIKELKRLLSKLPKDFDEFEVKYADIQIVDEKIIRKDNDCDIMTIDEDKNIFCFMKNSKNEN